MSKFSPDKPSIYVIFNTENNHVYVGQSINVRDRWKTHIRALETNSHTNKALQYDWNNTDDKSIFMFRIVKNTGKGALDREEISMIKALGEFLTVYNVDKTNLVKKRYVDDKIHIQRGVDGND